jgi:hypothetical protein
VETLDNSHKVFFLSLLTVVAILTIFATRNFWLMSIGSGLVCHQRLTQSEAILVEDFEPDYILFEKAATLRKANFASRVIVPVQVSHESEQWNAVAVAIAELKAQMAQIPEPEIVPIHATEPITLNTTYAIRDYLAKEHVRTVIVVASGFRSKRSSMIYDAVLTPAGITISCVPVFTGAATHNWPRSWHGIEEVSEQFLKLQYYRFYVLWKKQVL